METGLFSTSSQEETEALGARLAQSLTEGDVLLISGDLGAGKTCLVRGIVGALRKGEKNPVRSPSFTILNIYEGQPVVYHFDFYRLEGAKDLEALGLYEYAGQGICLVEWPGTLLSGSQGKKYDVMMADKGNSTRTIEIRRSEEK